MSKITEIDPQTPKMIGAARNVSQEKIKEMEKEGYALRMVVSDHPEDNNALVRKFVKVDKATKVALDRAKEAQKLDFEVKELEAEVANLERMEKIKSLKEKRKELEKTK